MKIGELLREGFYIVRILSADFLLVEFLSGYIFQITLTLSSFTRILVGFVKRIFGETNMNKNFC